MTTPPPDESYYVTLDGSQNLGFYVDRIHEYEPPAKGTTGGPIHVVEVDLWLIPDDGKSRVWTTDFEAINEYCKACSAYELEGHRLWGRLLWSAMQSDAAKESRTRIMDFLNKHGWLHLARNSRKLVDHSPEAEFAEAIAIFLAARPSHIQPLDNELDD